MNQNLSILLTFFILGCGTKPDSNLDRWGIYNGTIEHGNFSDVMSFEIEKDSADLTVSFTSLEQNAYQIPCQGIKISGDSISFELRSDFYTYSFKNLWIGEGQELKGVLSVDTINVPYKLTKAGPAGKNIPENDEVHFQSNGLTLNGTIWYPDSPDKKGLVLITSSGGPDRSASRAEAILFAQKGFTTFHYDKRGTGASDGNWMEARMDELLSDDMKAIEFFSESTGIPYESIGIKGSSQGAAKVPFILGELGDLKFGIVVSCPGASLLESDLNYWKNRNEAGLNQNAVEAVGLQRKIFEFIAGNVSRDQINILVEEAKPKSWFSSLWIPDFDEIQIDTKLNYDPIPYFSKTKQPILILQGSQDEIIPLTSYKSISEALTEAQNSNFHIALLDGANHSMNYVGKSDFPYWSKLHPDYFKETENWLNSIYEKK